MKTEPCKHRGKKEIVNRKMESQQNYTRHSFQVADYHDDKKSRKLQEYILPDTINIREAGKCTDKAERSIQTVKQQMILMVQSTPYIRMPKLMI